MTEVLKDSESLESYSAQARNIASALFEKHNPNSGDLFSYQVQVKQGYIGANFNMLVESGSPDEKFAALISRNWEGGADAHHTMITLGIYDESRFFSKLVGRGNQIQMDILDLDDSKDILRFDWTLNKTSVNPAGVTVDKAKQLLQTTEDMLKRNDNILHFSKLIDTGVLR